MLTNFDQTSPESILAFAKKLLGTNLKSILPPGYKPRGGKGGLGQLLEEHYFHKPLDSDSKPDFPDAGVELKATPIKKFSRKGIGAKERLSLNIINYDDLVNETWENSHFLSKNSLLLLVFYLYEENQINIDHLIKIVELYSFLDYEEDLKVIQNDWITIQYKVLEGKAHELSEGDTQYLGACTKGAKNQKPRSQPFSSTLAKQRAFCFKQGYVNYILKRIQGKTREYDSLFKNDGLDIAKISIEQRVKTLFKPYLGKTAFELGNIFGMEFKNQKGYYAKISDNIVKMILGVKNLNKVSEFEKANISLKTIRVSYDGTIQEDISFPAFKFCEIIKEDWYDSELYNLLESTKFLFIKYRITTNTVAEFDRLNDTEKNKFLILDEVYLWNAPVNDIENYAKQTWRDTIKIIKEGVIINPIIQKSGKVIERNNLPKSRDTKMIHVRPHGINKKDIDILPNGKELTKQCFWFNKSYIKDQLGF
ncbi:MAG: Sau3AI family type II restriction endonuclease [Candidatus Altimarinota bacterium]